jgi:hypothetical protein
MQSPWETNSRSFILKISAIFHDSWVLAPYGDKIIRDHHCEYDIIDQQLIESIREILEI